MFERLSTTFPDCDPKHLDALATVRTREAVPPETAHVHELGIVVEERGQCVRIPIIPRVH